MEDNILTGIRSYVMSHREEVQDIIDTYFSSGAYTLNLDNFMEAFPEILYGIYDFFLDSEYIPEVISTEIHSYLTDENYTALTRKLIHIWTHGAIPLTIQWEMAPKELSRKILVPLRCNLSDVMYASLASLRSALKESVLLESKEFSFLSGIEEAKDEDMSYTAGMFPSYQIYALEFPKLVYGYEEAWVFHLKPAHLRILDTKRSKAPMVVMDGRGYGIFEDSLEDVAKLCKNPMALNASGIRIKDMLGINFFDAKIDELEETAPEEFYMIQYRYEAGPMME